MKKSFLVFLLSLVLIGAGCFGGARDERWRLSFDLPEGWVMYTAGSGGFAGDAETPITKETGEIVLQNTDDSIHAVGTVADGATEYQGKPIRLEGYAFIRAFELDERRKISSDAEDLGKGFYRERKCVDSDGCLANGIYEYAYYYQKGDAKYQFTIVTNGIDPQEAIDVILSAKAVSIE